MKRVKNIVVVSVVVVLSFLIGELLQIRSVKADVYSPPSLESEVMVGNGNGFGSTATNVRRFSSVFVNIGTAITYTDDTTYGASFTINTPGIYAINYSDWRHDAADGFYITSDIGPANTNSYTNLDTLCTVSTSGTLVNGCAATVELDQGDVVRPYWGGGGFGSQCCAADTAARFTVTRVR